MASNFSSIPILDWSLTLDPATRQQFVSQLRHAAINVGFLYLSNSTVSQGTVDTLIKYIPKLFALPQDAKEKIRMANSEHFLGYSRLGAEFTKGKTDIREQFDFATPHVSRWKPGDPDHYRLWGPSQVCGVCLRALRYLDSVSSGQMKILSLDSKPLWRNTSYKSKN